MRSCIVAAISLVAIIILAVSLASGPVREKLRERSARRQLSAVMDVQERKASPDKFIVRGKGGSLFYIENVRYCLTDWDKREDHNIRVLNEIDNYLKSRGILFFVVPVPTKLDLYPECLVDRPPRHFSRRYDHLTALLRKQGLHCIDVLPALAERKAKTALFARSDTHWNEDAIETAAARIAAAVRPFLAPVSAPVRFSCEPETLVYYGDLGEKLPRDSAAADTVVLDRIAFPDGRCFSPDPHAPLVVCGDSFVKQYREYCAAVDAHVARELGMAVQSAYWITSFDNTSKRIKQLLKDGNNTRVVVWIVTALSFTREL